MYLLCVIRTLACVCVFTCVWYVLCLCTQNKALSPEVVTPPPHSSFLIYCTQTSSLLLPSSLAVKHIYNFHSSRTKTLDCLSLLPAVFTFLSPALCRYQSFTLSHCQSATPEQSVFIPFTSGLFDVYLPINKPFCGFRFVFSSYFDCI